MWGFMLFNSEELSKVIYMILIPQYFGGYYDCMN